MKIVVAFMVLISVAAASAQVQVYEKLTINKPTQKTGQTVKAPAPPRKGK